MERTALCQDWRRNKIYIIPLMDIKIQKAKVKVQVQLLMEIIFLKAAPKKAAFFIYYLLTKKLQTSPSAII